MTRVVQALTRALNLMFSPRVWLLIWKPALFSALFWLVIMLLVCLIWGDDIRVAMTQAQNWIAGQWRGDNWWEVALNGVMGFFAFMLTAVLFVVLTVIWAMVLISVFGMSRINRLVASRYFPDLHQEGKLSSWQTVWHAMKWTFWFAFFWIISVPAYVLAGAGALLHGGIIARYNQKVFTLDALADHATHEEFETISERHNVNLFVLGVAVTLLGALPTFVWVGSALGLALLPVTGILSVLTFTALFTYCGLAYSLYCLQALQDLRQERITATQTAPDSSVVAMASVDKVVTVQNQTTGNIAVENHGSEQERQS